MLFKLPVTINVWNRIVSKINDTVTIDYFVVSDIHNKFAYYT